MAVGGLGGLELELHAAEPDPRQHHRVQSLPPRGYRTAGLALGHLQPGSRAGHGHPEQPDPPQRGYGIALDASCSGVLVENNLVYHQGQGGVHFNWYCLGNIVQNNVFAFGRQGQMTRYGDPPPGACPGICDSAPCCP